MFRRFYDRFFGYDIFISYSRSDSLSYARTLSRSLVQSGFTVFLDEREIPAGVHLDKHIEAAIQKSSAVVPVISPGADSSKFVKQEIALAIRCAKQIIPISLNESIRDPSWRDIQQFRWIDATVPWRKDVPDGTEQIASQVENTFAAVRRDRFRLSVTAMVACLVLAFMGIAGAYYRESKIQEAFGLFSRGLEAATAMDAHTAQDYFAQSLAKFDSTETRSALVSVWDAPVWLWDSVAGGGTSHLNEPQIPPKIAFSADGTSVLSIHGTRLAQHESLSGSIRKRIVFPDAIADVAINPSNDEVFVALHRGEVWVLSTDLQKVDRKFKLEGKIRTLKLSARGAMFATGMKGEGLRVMDASSGEEWFRSPAGQHEQTVESISFSPDSTRMYWTMGRWIYASEPTSQFIQLITQQDDLVQAVAWSLDGTLVAVAGIDGPIQLLRQRSRNAGIPTAMLSGRTREQPPLTELSGHDSGVTTLMFSPSKKSLLISGGFDGRVRFWDTVDGRLLYSLPMHQVAVSDLAVSANGNQIASVDRSGRLRLWQKSPVFGKTIKSPSAPSSGKSARHWNGPTIETIADAGDKKLFLGYANGSISSFSSDDETSLDEKTIFRLRGHFLEKSSDGQSLAALDPTIAGLPSALPGSGVVRLFNRTRTAWKKVSEESFPGVTAVAWSWEPGKLVLGTAQGRVFTRVITDAATPQEATLAEREASITDLQVASHARSIAIAWSDGLIQIWSSTDSVKTLQYGKDLHSISISPDGHYLMVNVIGPSAHLVIHDLILNKIVYSQRDWIRHHLINDKTGTAVFGTDPGGEIFLVDLATGATVGKWLAHAEGVAAIALTTDGSLLHTLGNRGEIRAWPTNSVDRLQSEDSEALVATVLERTGRSVKLPDTKAPSPTSEVLDLNLGAAGTLAEDSFHAVTARLVRRIMNDEEPLPADCKTILGKSQDGLKFQSQILTSELLKAACLRRSNNIALARQKFQSAENQFVESMRRVEGRELISPSLIIGIRDFLDLSVREGDISSIGSALSMVNAAFLAGSDSSVEIGYPTNELEGAYFHVLNHFEERDALSAIREALQSLIAQLESSKKEIPRAVPRIAMRLATPLALAEDLQGAVSLSIQAEKIQHGFVSQDVMSGSQSALSTRQMWAQLIAQSATFSCFLADKLQRSDDEATIANSRRHFRTAKQLADSLSSQVQILEESQGLSSAVRASIEGLSSTLRWCSREMR